MAAFEYTALNQKGRQQRGVLEADSARHARQLLREKDLLPTKVESSGAEPSSKGGVFSFTSGLSSFERVLFIRQLATLVGSSMPIEEALKAVAEQTEKQRVATLIMAVRSKVLEGYTLAASLREQPKSFNALFCSTVAAGEQSGYLSKVLENLADYIERQYEATSSVKSALFYPATVLLLAFFIVGALMVYVVPDMVNVIIDSGQQLPWFTLVLIDLSDFLSAFWWLLLAALGALIVFARWLLSRPGPKLIWDRFKFRIPLVSRVTRNSNAASYTNTLSILTRSGVPLVDAMAIAGDVVGNTWLKQGLMKATQTVSEGVALKTSLDEIGQFPPMVLHMIAAGEQSGELDEMLGRVAVFQQREVERVLGAVLKLIEPAMLLVMGGIVLFIVMAVMLPMLSMNQMV